MVRISFLKYKYLLAKNLVLLQMFYFFSTSNLNLLCRKKIVGSNTTSSVKSYSIISRLCSHNQSVIAALQPATFNVEENSVRLLRLVWRATASFQVCNRCSHYTTFELQMVYNLKYEARVTTLGCSSRSICTKSPQTTLLEKAAMEIELTNGKQFCLIFMAMYLMRFILSENMKIHKAKYYNCSLLSNMKGKDRFSVWKVIYEREGPFIFWLLCEVFFV